MAMRGSPGAGRTERDLRRRTMSQNFLRDAMAVDQFIGLVEVDPDLLVVEVGAGRGQLTQALAKLSRAVLAFELDPDMARQLEQRMRPYPNVAVVVADFRVARPPQQPFQLVGNLPFGITAAIVDWCLHAPTLTSATMITQLEYARKRTGSFGRWSLLTVRTWPEFTWQLRGRIARTQFRPIPRVDAGVLHLQRRPRGLVPAGENAAYIRMVELGFTGVGGSLYASLSRRYPSVKLAAAFRAARLDRGTVVAFVHPDQWLELFAALEGVRG